MRILFLLLLLFPATSAFAQAESATPVKGANKILIHTPDSAAKALVLFARTLQAAGAPIDQLNKDLLSITTKAVNLPHSQYVCAGIYLAIASDGANSTIAITGNAAGVILQQPITLPAALKGAEKGFPTAAFRFMEAAAKAYPGGRVGYVVQR